MPSVDSIGNAASFGQTHTQLIITSNADRAVAERLRKILGVGTIVVGANSDDSVAVTVVLGADALVFPNHGGRFGYSPQTCRDIAQTGLGEWHGLKPAVPVPAGGMTIDRVAEMLDFYGADVMLLIGGALLSERERLTEATAAFVAEVEGYAYG